MKVAPCRVSGRVVYTVIFSSLPSTCEVYLCTVGFADPVSLHLLYLLRPVQLVQIIQQTVCICGDLQHPLTQILLGNRGAAALAAAVDNFLVCQTGLTGRTPVDGELLLISQALL